MNGALVLALPSKGRLKEQAEAWLADSGLPISAGGERAYTAEIAALAGIEVRLVSTAEIAEQLVTGEVHLGVTGEDLLRELAGSLEGRVVLLQALGFGHADLVVAAPRSWIDVADMADVDEVAHLFLARTGRRLRVATKFPSLTRAFFARHGVADYRIVESAGATEGAPAAGAAELIVDITTTGATLAANGLKRLAGGLILASQAQLAASPSAGWDDSRLKAATGFVRIIEARARARRAATLAWPAGAEAAARAALAAAPVLSAQARPHGVLVDAGELFGAAEALARAGVGPVGVTRPAYVFEAGSRAMERLEAALRSA